LSKLLRDERQLRIHEILRAQRSVRVVDLSDHLQVSEATIRRDLASLESRGLLERTHGGSILTQQMTAEPLYPDKDQRLTDEKAEIGQLAAALAQPGERIFINSGSTNRQVLHQLASRSQLRLVTNNAAATVEPGVARDNELLVLGGRYRPASNSYVGPFAAGMLRQIHADRFFMGADGVSLRRGLTTPNAHESEITRLMLEQTLGEVVLVADHTKIGVVAHFVTAPLEVISTLVTDQLPPPEFADALAEREIKVITPDTVMPDPPDTLD
jgi:DeoR/GlpR family transcriptional regulator of sugar metabolism